MKRLCVLLAVLLAMIVAYTTVVIARHGINLLPTFFGDIARLGWAGQFNVDFVSFLALSAAWVAWRSSFSPGGLALAVLAFFGGGLFLTLYLLILIYRGARDPVTLFAGDRLRTV